MVTTQELKISGSAKIETRVLNEDELKQRRNRRTGGFKRNLDRACNGCVSEIGGIFRILKENQ